MRLSGTRLSGALFVGLFVALTVGSARATDAEDKAAAETLFDAAQKLMKAGNFAEACPKLMESHRLDPTTGTLFNLARCHEGEGKTASAWVEYRSVEQRSRKEGFGERADLAKSLADKLEPRLVKIEVRAKTQVPGLVVKRDTTEIGAASFGLATAVDPGEHTVSAAAPGYREWSTKVTTTTEGEVRVVEVPPLERLPASAPTASVSVSTSVSAAPSGNTEAPVPFWGGQRIASVVTAGVGLAGVGVGAVFGGLAISKKDESGCVGSVCKDEQGIALYKDARGTGNLSTAFLGGGGAVLGAAVLLFVLAPSARPAPGARSTPAPTIAVGPQGIAVQGAW